MSGETALPSCTHYDLSLAIVPEAMHPAYTLYGGTIQVDCTATIENRTTAPVRTVPLLLYRLLHVDEVSDASGAALPFSQAVVALSDLRRMQVNTVEVSLLAALPAGASTRLRLRYGGPVCGYTEVYPYVHDHVSERYTLLRREVLWFPVVARSLDGCWRDASTFDLVVHVPRSDAAAREPWIAITNGQCCEVKSGPEGLRYRWHTTEAQGRLTVACAPFRQADISPDVSLYYLPEDEVGAQVVARAMVRTRELCTAWFGLMPARSLRIVEIPGGWGSEASATLILQTGEAFQAKGSDDADAYRRALSRAGHELIHLWGVPSAEEHVSRFLDEGITQYLEALLLREEAGEDAYWKRLNDYRSYFLSSGEAAASVPLAQAGLHDTVREAVSRGKGPWLMCVLHHLLGERTLVALRAFFDRYRDRGATLEDFQAAMTDAVSADADAGLTTFFQEWLWGVESSAYLAQEIEGPELVRRMGEKYA
jgi:hypothetical protein